MNNNSLAARFVQGFVMLPNFKATSKKEAIEKIIDEIAKSCPKNIVDREKAKEAVFAREESMPTGLDHGLAVPHGRTDGVNNIVGAVAIIDNSENENGSIADYETIDHSKLQFIVLTLVPSEGQTPYLQLMAFIGKVMKTDNASERLLACKTEKEMKNFFRSIK